MRAEHEVVKGNCAVTKPLLTGSIRALAYLSINDHCYMSDKITQPKAG